RVLNYQAVGADRESARESGKDGVRTSPRADAEKAGFGTLLSNHQTPRARFDMGRQRAALSIQPRTRPERMDDNRQLRKRNQIHRNHNGLLRNHKLASEHTARIKM